MAWPVNIVCCNTVPRFESPQMWVWPQLPFHACTGGRVKMEPFVLLAFFPCFIAFLVHFVMKPVVVSLRFPLFYWISAGF